MGVRRWLKTLIVERYGTQRRLADHLDIEESVVSDLVHGRRRALRPRGRDVAKVAKALGLTVGELMEGKDGQ